MLIILISTVAGIEREVDSDIIQDSFLGMKGHSLAGNDNTAMVNTNLEYRLNTVSLLPVFIVEHRKPVTFLLKYIKK